MPLVYVSTPNAWLEAWYCLIFGSVHAISSPGLSVIVLTEFLNYSYIVLIKSSHHCQSSCCNTRPLEKPDSKETLSFSVRRGKGDRAGDPQHPDQIRSHADPIPAGVKADMTSFGVNN